MKTQHNHMIAKIKLTHLVCAIKQVYHIFPPFLCLTICSSCEILYHFSNTLISVLMK